MNLANLRERAGLTQDAVSDSLNIDRSAVAKWESGDAKPRADKLPMLAKLYNCTIDELFEEGKDDRPT